jgi:phage gp46-like protein
MSDVFEGDLLLEDSPDFGEIKIVDGLFVSDKSFNTAVYLSLYGGNVKDSGRVRNKETWWGNTLPAIAENEKMVSRFQAIIFGMPMTSKNIPAAEKAAELDLKWIKDEGVADKITATGKAAGKNKFELRIEMKSTGVTIYDNKFYMFWREGAHGGNNH